jgi:hypothetical protein
MLEDATGTPPFPFFGRTAAPLDGFSVLVVGLRCCRVAAADRSGLAAPVVATRVRVGSGAGAGFAGLGVGAGVGSGGSGGSAAGVALRCFASALLAARDGAPRRRAAARSLPLGGGSDPVTAAYPLWHYA